MKKLNKAVDLSLFAILAAMALSMAVNVFCRFVLNFSISWADELSQSLMLWLTFIGAAAVLRDHGHYAFTYLDSVFRGKMRTAYSLVNRILTFVAICLLLFWSVQVTEGITKWIMPALNVNRVWVYGACPVGCVLMIVYSVQDIVGGLRMISK